MVRALPVGAHVFGGVAFLIRAKEGTAKPRWPVEVAYTIRADPRAATVRGVLEVGAPKAQEIQHDVLLEQDDYAAFAGLLGQPNQALTFAGDAAHTAVLVAVSEPYFYAEGWYACQAKWVGY